MKLKSAILLVTSFVVLGTAVDVFGDITSGTWFLDQSNTFADGVLYGRVDIVADSASGMVSFTVDPFDVQPTYGSLTNFGVNAFGFNYTNAVTSSPDTWTVNLPVGWSQDDDGGTMDGFGRFRVTEDGTGSTRQDPLAFTITVPTASEAVAANFATLSSGTAGEGNVFFAAHVASFANDPGSHFIGGQAVVPAPGALLLGVIGLGIVRCVKRWFA